MCLKKRKNLGPYRAKDNIVQCLLKGRVVLSSFFGYGLFENNLIFGSIDLDLGRGLVFRSMRRNEVRRQLAAEDIQATSIVYPTNLFADILVNKNPTDESQFDSSKFSLSG